MVYPNRTEASIPLPDVITEAEDGIRNAMDAMQKALQECVAIPEAVDKTSTLAWVLHMYGRELR